MACKLFGTLRFFKPTPLYVRQFGRLIIVQPPDMTFQAQFKSTRSGLYIWRNITAPNRPELRGWTELTMPQVQEFFNQKELFVRKNGL